MRSVRVTLESTTPYSQSRQHETLALDKEGKDEYEKRTWREKCSYDSHGEVYIPAMAFKQALDAAAKKLGQQIPGKGKSTYTKFFVSDVICNGNVPLGVTKDDVDMVRISANVDGIRGSGKRVWRQFPVIQHWSADVEFTIMDDTVTKKVFEETLSVAGQSVGIGRFRPEKGGLNGRFKLVKTNWQG